MNKIRIDRRDLPHMDLIECVRALVSAFNTRYGTPTTIYVGYAEYNWIENNVFRYYSSKSIAGNIVWGLTCKTVDEISYLEITDE